MQKLNKKYTHKHTSQTIFVTNGNSISTYYKKKKIQNISNEMGLLPRHTSMHFSDKTKTIDGNPSCLI